MSNYYQENKEKLIEKQKERNKKNKEKIKEYRKNYIPKKNYYEERKIEKMLDYILDN